MEQEERISLCRLTAVPEIGMLCVMDKTGDARVQWDKLNPEEVAKARAKFDVLKSNHIAYTLNAKGEEEVIYAFDPNAERIIMHKTMIGG